MMLIALAVFVTVVSFFTLASFKLAKEADEFIDDFIK